MGKKIKLEEGVAIEYNTMLALRQFGTPRISPAEGLPKDLKIGKVYDFLKKGFRVYPLGREIPLAKTDGEQISKPIAKVMIMNTTQHISGDETYTKGEYVVMRMQ